MQNLQAEHRAWVDAKYPNQPPEIPAAGCVEEAGELMHAVLKLEQIRLWGEDARYKLAELRPVLADAIGDCAIYACSLCNANGWVFEFPEATEVSSSESNTALELAAELVLAAVGVAKNPRSKSKLNMYMHAVNAVAINVGIDAESAIATTWERVKCR